MNLNDTEANAAGRSGNARALGKQSKCGVVHGGKGNCQKFSQKLYKPRAGLPVRPGELCRCRLGGILPANLVAIPLPSGGGGSEKLQKARLPVRPGGLFKRRLDGTLSVSY